jgi:hypothetical protein
MPLFALTSALREHLESAVKGAPRERAEMYEQCLQSGEMSLETALALKRDLPGTPSVVTLLRGCRVVARPPQPKRFVQSAETRAKFDTWRRELQDKQYRHMVENVTAPLERNAHRDRRELKSFRDQMGIAANVVITRVALLVAGWWVGHRALGPVWGPVMGIACMVIGMAAEMGIFMIRNNQLDRVLDEREKKETLMFPHSVKPAEASVEKKKNV